MIVSQTPGRPLTARADGVLAGSGPIGSLLAAAAWSAWSNARTAAGADSRKPAAGGWHGLAVLGAAALRAAIGGLSLALIALGVPLAP